MAEKKNTGNDKLIKIQLIKSTIGCKKDQIGTVRALGLRKMHQIKEIKDNAVSRGMIFKVKHLVKVL